MKQIIILALCGLAFPAFASNPMSAHEFETYVTGKTLYFGLAGTPYGAEEYLPGRTVRWSFLDGNCKEGRWYEEAGEICFVYEDAPVPQCWSFYQEEGKLRAVFQSDPAAPVLYEAEEQEDPMLCFGPDVGV